MSNMQAYLASRYMSGAKAEAIIARDESTKPKKKKRKIQDDQAEGSSSGGIGGGLGIVDEDMGLGGRSGGRRGLGGNDSGEDEDSPLAVAEAPKLASKTKKNWTSTGTSSSIPLPPRARTRSRSGSPPPDPESPPADLPHAPEPQKKRKGGLMTAAEVALEAEAQARARAAEEAARAAENAANPSSRPAKNDRETVYRDKTGAIIDIAAERALTAQKAAEEKRKEAERKEWGRGLVQREEKDERAKMERDMGRSRAVGRRKDDVALNEEQRGVERWDDPAAAFLTKKTGRGPAKPKYTGPPAPPNRFNIAPGYRWDGVDRSTGFEAKLFQSMNTKRRVGVEAAAWSMEDM